MVSARRPTSEPPTSDTDQRILMYNMSWEQFEAMLAARGDKPVPRMAYLEGTIELMSPSRRHENRKYLLGRLVDAYLLEKLIYFDPIASTTLKNELLERGAEPDESYAFARSRDVPDLAIEAVLTSGGLDKLNIYRGLGVREVWFWYDKARELKAFALRAGKYEPINESEVLPGISLSQIEEYAGREDAFEAVVAFRAVVRGERKPAPRMRAKRTRRKPR